MPSFFPSLAQLQGLFKFQVVVTQRSAFQFHSINTKALPCFVTILYSREACSVWAYELTSTTVTLQSCLKQHFFSSAWQFCIGMTDNIQPSRACLYLVCVRKTTIVSHKLELSLVSCITDFRLDNWLKLNK